MNDPRNRKHTDKEKFCENQIKKGKFTCPDQTPRLESSSFGAMMPVKQSNRGKILGENFVHWERVGGVNHSN